MAKIGTAHVEIKPVLAEEALDALCKQVEERVAAAVRRGLDSVPPCGNQTGGIGGRTLVCALPAGHNGWHCEHVAPHADSICWGISDDQSLSY